MMMQSEDNKSERVPVRTLLQGGLSRFRADFDGLLKTMTAATSGRNDAASLSAVDQAFKRLLAANQEIKAAVRTLRKHQSFQQKLLKLENDIERKNADILQLSSVLRKVQDNIEKEIFQNAKPLLGKATGSSLNPVEADTVLKYSRLLSYSTAAPPGWHFSHGLEIPFPYKPPAPQAEEHMKRGLLYKTNFESVLKSYEKDEENEEEEDDDDIQFDNTIKKRSLEEENATTEEAPLKIQRKEVKPPRSLSRQLSTMSDDGFDLFDL